jgi:hypothetical protein
LGTARAALLVGSSHGFGWECSRDLIAPGPTPNPKLGDGLAVVLDRRDIIPSAWNRYGLELSSDGLGVILGQDCKLAGGFRSERV